MKSILSFKQKMRVLDMIQRLGLCLGFYIRPSRVLSNSFLKEFLEPKPCGIDMLMIGDGSDGTYVIPNDIEGITKCFSPGVGPSSQFEETLFDRYGIKSFLLDASVSHVPSSRSDFYVFEKKYLGGSMYENFIDLNTWITTHAGANKGEDLLLQMDIEGGEFAALLACSHDVLNRFRIIAIEIHFLDALNLDFFSSVVEQTFRKLDANFQVCFAHINDCCGSIHVGKATFPRVVEVTLIRKDRLRASDNVQTYSFPIKNS